MERQTLLELLRMVLIAFVIAMVINFFRVLIFQNGNFWDTFWRRDVTNNEVTNTDNYVNTQNLQANERAGENTPAINNYLKEGVINIPVAPLKQLSGLSKAEILEMRTSAVKTSPIFSDMDYTPSSDVFQIDDGMPWISADAALHWSNVSTDEKSNGVSRDSIGILNPELLYYVSIREYGEGSVWIPFYKPSLFEPYRVVYKPETKTIIAYIKNERNKKGNYEPITLADSNAHDLGYKYAYMDSYDNVGFYDRDNYKNNSLHLDIKEVTGWYMHGPACGLPGGCNNYAPYWQYHNTFYLENLPASFNIKLWKQRPTSVSQEADINFKMVFE